MVEWNTIRDYIDRGKIANMNLIYWSVRSSSRKGGNVVKGIQYRYFSQLGVSLY